MFCKAKQMLKKARQGKHGKHPTILSRWHADTDYQSSLRSTTLAKKKSCFSIASLLKDMTIRLRKLNVCRTPNIGSFVWMLMGPTSLFDSDQKLPLHQNNASKMQDAFLTEERQSPKTGTSTKPTKTKTRSTVRKRRKLRLPCRSKDWMAVLQRATEKPVGSILIFNIAVARRTVADDLDFLASISSDSGGDFGFMKGITENRDACVDRTPTLKTHLCSTVSSQRAPNN